MMATATSAPPKVFLYIPGYGNYWICPDALADFPESFLAESVKKYLEENPEDDALAGFEIDIKYYSARLMKAVVIFIAKRTYPKATSKEECEAYRHVFEYFGIPFDSSEVYSEKGNQ